MSNYLQTILSAGVVMALGGMLTMCMPKKPALVLNTIPKEASAVAVEIATVEQCQNGDCCAN